MLRVAVRFAYDGGAFESYARQPGHRTVEDVLLAALGREGLVAGSFRTGSRTDGGVSAAENVAAASLDRPHLRGLVPAVQARLPAGLWMTAAALAPEGWDPRKASWRRYVLLHPDGGEDLPAMRTAAGVFVGRHDVRAFARVEAGRSPERTVTAVRVVRQAGLLRFSVTGQSFLWNQVRRTVGALLAVGRGQAAPADVEASLRSGRAHPRFGLAPPEGLVLQRVAYRGLRWDAAAGSVTRASAQAHAAAVARASVAAAVARLARGP